jgi:hypothetical protein
MLKTALTISDVVAGISASVELANSAKKEDDVRGLRAALELKMRFERRGGEILGKRGSDSDLGKQRAARWRAYAEMAPDVFEERMTANVSRAAVIVARGYCHSTTMVLSPWKKDEFGNPFRTLTAIEKSK